MLLKVVLSSYIDVREVTEPAWEKANLEFDLKSDLQENDPSTLPDSSEATVAFSRTTTPHIYSIILVGWGFNSLERVKMFK